MEITREEFADFIEQLHEDVTKAKSDFESDYASGTVDWLLNLKEKADMLYEILTKARTDEYSWNEWPVIVEDYEGDYFK